MAAPLNCHWKAYGGRPLVTPTRKEAVPPGETIWLAGWLVMVMGESKMATELVTLPSALVMTTL